MIQGESKNKWKLVSMLLVFTLLLQVAYPALTEAKELFYEMMLGPQDINITVLDNNGEPFKDVELELVQSHPTGYQRVQGMAGKTDEEGELVFLGVYMDSSSDYGIIAKGWIQSPEYEFVKDPVVWFTPLTKGEDSLTLSLQDIELHRLKLRPLDNEENLTVHGDINYISIFGRDSYGVAYSKVINTFNLDLAIVLAEGDYTLQACANMLYGEGYMPNYFISEDILVNSDKEVVMGGASLAKISFETVDNNKVSGISIYPQDIYESSIFYGGNRISDTYLTPGTYKIIFALSSLIDDDWTYFFEKEIDIEDAGEITINVDDNFSSTIIGNKSSLDKGETIEFEHEIIDSYGNRLIGKAYDLNISHDREEAYWVEDSPTLRILNSQNLQVYEETRGDNRSIFDRWNGWNGYDMSNDSYYSNLVPIPSTDNTYFSSSYRIPEEAIGGVYTAKLDLGEGTYELTSEDATFIVKGEESAPVLDTLKSPTNAETLIIKGTSIPEKNIELYYTLNDGENTLLGTVQSAAANGRFEYTFVPDQEGIYSFTARIADEANPSEYSLPITVVLDWTPPSKPLNLEGISPNDKTISLTWQAPLEEDTVAYEVYRDDSLLATVEALSYEDTGLSSGRFYNYAVIAVDLAGNKSEPASLTIATTDKPELNIASVNWNAQWDKQDHVVRESTFRVSIVATSESNARAIMEYEDKDRVSKTVDIILEELHVEGNGTSNYTGSVTLPEDVAIITKLTGNISKGEYSFTEDAVGLPCNVNSSLNIRVSLSEEASGNISDIKNAYISLSSQSKSFRKEMRFDGSSQYLAEALIPADDYNIKIMTSQRVIAEVTDVKVSAGTIEDIDLVISVMTANLDIRVVDEQGQPINNFPVTVLTSDGSMFIAKGYSGNDGWVRAWNSQNDPIVKDRLEGEELKVIVDTPVNNQYYWEHYTLPTTQKTTLRPGDNELEVIVSDRPIARLSGTVRRIDGVILNGATITAFTKVGQFEINRSTISDKDGNYELDIVAGNEVKLVVNHRLTESKEFEIGPILGGKNVDYDIYLPLEKRISIDVKSKNIGELEYYNNPLLTYSIKITNKGTDSKPKNLSADVYGDLFAVPVPDAEPGDNVEIVVDGGRSGYSKETATVTLDEDAWAAAEINLVEQGKIEAVLIDPIGNSFDNEPIFAYVFKQESGELVYKSNSRSWWSTVITNNLEEGLYTVVFYSEQITTVMDFDDIIEYYGENATVIQDIEVVDGEINKIGETIVRKHEVPGWYYFKGHQGNGFWASTNETTPGRIVTFTASYDYEGVSGLSNLAFYLTIPKGTEYVKDSLVVRADDGTKEPLAFDDFIYGDYLEVRFSTPNLKKVKGTIKYQVRVLDNPQLPTIGARYWAEFIGDGYTQVTETIAEVNVKVPYLSLNVSSLVAYRTIPVSGQGPSNSIVKIYDSGYYLGEATIGNNGLWRATVTLPNRGSRATHYLRAETTSKTSGEAIRSEIQAVSLDPNQPVITKIEFGQRDRGLVEVKEGATFRFNPSSSEDGANDFILIVYFNDISRIKDYKVHSREGDIIASGEQIEYSSWENKITATWSNFIIEGEIRISYDLERPTRTIDDFELLDEDVIRSSLPPLWMDATRLRDSAAYNETKDTFELESEMLLGDGNTIIKTEMEISNYDGEFSFDENLPIEIMGFEFNEDSIEMTFIVPRDLIFTEIKDEQNKSSLQSKSISIMSAIGVGARAAIQFVRVRMTQEAVKKGFDIYDIYDTCKNGFDHFQKIDRLNKLLEEINKPCFSENSRQPYIDLIENEKVRVGGSTMVKAGIGAALFMVGLAIPVVGWGAVIAVGVGTTLIGFLADVAIDNFMDKHYEDTKRIIDNSPYNGCQPDDDNGGGGDGGGSGKNGIGPGTPIAYPVPVTLIDPSGYVYEGVEDNRIEGVVATAYEEVDGEWVLWDSEWTGQKNPLITDEKGWYQWDVPAGWWQVVYEKEGYELAKSERLPVPPPQLEVNIGLISIDPPTVNIVAEPGGVIRLDFDKYMEVDTIRDNTFKVYEKELDEFGRNKYIPGTITAEDPKASPKDDTIQLARTFRFTPSEPLVVGETYSVWVSDMVYNYAKRTMSEEVNLDVTIPEKIVELVSIEITKPAKKLVYFVGDKLDITGLELEGVYSDGSRRKEVVTVNNITGFDSSRPTESQILTITIAGKTANYTIKIKALPRGDEEEPEPSRPYEPQEPQKPQKPIEDITITKIEGSIVPPKDMTLCGDILDIRINNDKLILPASIEVNFNKDSTKDIDIRKLGLYVQDENDTSKWIYVGGVVDVEGAKVIAYISRSGIYAVMANHRSFSDLTNHWSKKDVDVLISRHIVDGVNSNEFQPERSITRAEIAKLIVEILNFKLGYSLEDSANGVTTFYDVESAKWYTRYIQVVAKYGIMVGDKSNFRPEDPVTRQELAVIISKLLGLESKDEDTTLAFKDGDKVSSWAKEAVHLVYREGIMIGVSGDNFEPTRNLKRCEAASVILRVMEGLGFITKTTPKFKLSCL